MKKKFLLITTLFLMLAFFAGCAGKGEEVATDEPAAPVSTEADDTAEEEATEAVAETDAAETEVAEEAEVKYKDTLIFATGSDQNWMDGQMNNTNDKVLRTVYSSLVKRTPENELVGDLAERWEVAEDGVTWTFFLKEGVKFHNGKELTAADVKASYDRLTDEENPVRYTGIHTFIDECVIVDDYTVQLVTADPLPNMITNLTHRANLILDADFIEMYGADLGLTVETINGTGPYKLVKWDVDERMEFEAFEDYFGGMAPTKNLVIMVVSEPASRAIAIETGEVDIVDGLPSEDLKRLSEVEGIKVEYFPGIGMHGLQFNAAHEYLKETKLRQAVSYAIDRELIVNTLYNVAGGEVPSTAPVNPNVWGYHNFGVIKQDQQKAKDLMAEAGYPDGFDFSIMVYTGYIKSLETVEMIQAQLAEVGINVTIEPVDNAGFNAALGNRTSPGEDFPWGMFFMGYGPSNVDADGLRRVWTTSPDGNNNNNYGWYSNPEVDAILAEASTEMDEEVRKDLYKQAMQILYIDDPAAVWTNDRTLAYAMKDTVEGFGINVVQAISWDSLAIRE